MHSRAIAVVAAALCLPATAIAATPTTATRHPVPPIHERFTPLPCSRSARTTLQLEGCAEHLVLSRDRQIDAVAGALDARLPAGGQQELVNGARVWLSSRNDDCAALVSQDAGGSAAGVVDAQCLAGEDLERISELRALLKDSPEPR